MYMDTIPAPHIYNTDKNKQPLASVFVREKRHVKSTVLCVLAIFLSFEHKT